MNMLKQVRDRLVAIAAEIRTLNEKVTTEERLSLTPEETTQYEALAAEREQLEAREAQLVDEEKRAKAAADARVLMGQTDADQPAAQTPATVAGKDLVYERGNGHSYFLDLIRSAVPGSEYAYAATERLQRHAEMLSRVPDKDIAPAFRAGPSKRAAGTAEQRVNPNRTPGQGGYFVPPVWLIDDFVPYLRAGRTTADLWQGMDLPAGTDSINLPKLSQGTLTGVQSDNGSVSSQDITDTFVTAPVRTIAGQEDIALQLLEQSPVGAGFDEVMLKDLLSSYNQQVDIQCITGNGTSPNLKGLANIAGINAITYTSGSPTAALLYAALGQAASQVARQRFQPPNAIVMTPQRWFWLTTQADTTGRPLVLPKSVPGFNAMGSFDTAAEGLVGEVFGIPIYIDSNIPSNVGAGTNQDTVYVAKFDDLILYEGAIRTRVLVETLSGTLQVRVQLYNYVAAMTDRFPVSISAINGTGLISPAGF